MIVSRSIAAPSFGMAKEAGSKVRVDLESTAHITQEGVIHFSGLPFPHLEGGGTVSLCRCESPVILSVRKCKAGVSTMEAAAGVW